jgi:uncharacterized protein (TIGR02271 family)
MQLCELLKSRTKLHGKGKNMSKESKHEHPGGEIPLRHGDAEELATHDSDMQTSGGRMTDSETLQLREEELHTRKESVESGRVRVGKDVVEEQQTLDVPVTREEVTIERHPVDRRPAGGRIGNDRETIRVPVHEEQVSVEKRAVVTEEISVGKQQIEETQHVSDTVRREEARIEHEGDVDLKQAR